MAEENVNVKFGASIDEMLRGISSMTSQFQSSINGMKTQLAGLQEVALGVQRIFLGVTAVLAGGAVFGKAVQETQRFILSNIDLASRLGISATEAGFLNLALEDARVSTGTFEAAVGMLSRTLTTNEDKIKKLGVATRDANGHFRNTVDILLDIIKRLNTFKEGSDRNVEGIKIFGRAWLQVQDILRLNERLMEESRKKAEALHLEITKQGVQSTVAYTHAMNDIGNVMQKLQMVIGEALMPILTNLANWFSEMGPTAVYVFRGAMATIVSLMWGLVFAAQAAYEIIVGSFMQIGTTLGALAAAAAAAMSGNFTGAKQIILDMFSDVTVQGVNAFDKIMERARAASKAIFELWDPDMTPMPKPKGDGGTSTGEDTTIKSRMAAWQTNWDVIRAAQNTALQSMTEDERSYWANILLGEKLSVEERIQVFLKLKSVEAQIQKQLVDEQLIELERSVMGERDMATRQMQLVERKLQATLAVYGKDSLEYKRAQLEMDRAHEERSRRAQARELAGLEAAATNANRRLELQRQTARNAETGGSINPQQRIALEAGIETEIYNNKLAVLKGRQAALSATQVEDRQRVLAEMEALEIEHVGRIQQLQFDAGQANVRFWENMLGPIKSAISTSVQGIILGTTTMRDAFRNLGVAMLASFVDLLAQISIKWIATQLGMTTVQTAQDAARSVASKVQAVTDIATAKTVALAEITAYAATAGAASMASAAAIPFYGWAIAPGVGAANYATALGYGPLAFAAKGFDVPADTVAMLHKREMVLPAVYADPLRAQLEGGGMGGGTVNHFHIKAWDGRSVEQMFLKHGTALGRGIENHVRNFGMMTVP